MKLAEALLRRKELQAKVSQLQTIQSTALFQVVVARRQVSETIDDITAKVPTLNAAEVTAEYDFYAHQLRVLDAAIQQANWTTELSMSTDVMSAFVPPEKKS